MSVFFYATIVAGFLLNFGATIPVAQFSPTLTCPPTYSLVNNVCQKNPENVHQISTAVQPCSTLSCQTTAVAQPCSTASCQTAACSTTPCHTTACSTTSCQTAVVNIQPTTQLCSTATSCLSCQPTINCQSTVTGCCQQRTCQEPCKQPCCCPTSPPQPPPTPPPPTRPPPPPTPPPPTRPPPPKPCPPGTILINDHCSLVYCGKGIYRDGKCIITVCPEGTVWTGSMCKAPVPQEHNFNITNTIYTNVNRTNDNHIMNYTNNITIHITEMPEHEPIPHTTPKSPTNCCIIVTPQSCAWDGYRHNCKSRRYRQCGSICTSIYIYLTPPIVQVIPPPPIPTCMDMDNNCGYDTTPFYPDCSTCDNLMEERCVTYCRRSTCQMRQCQAVDMRVYCDNYRGSIGCRRIDGCNQDWCE